MNLVEKYISITSIKHRKKFGQFYTPKNIADLMMRWLLEISPKSICDPAFGMGVFYNSAQENKFSGNFNASEKDKESFDFYNMYSSSIINLNLKNQDYFMNWGECYDAIICNPPYLKFQDIYDKEAVLSSIQDNINIKLSGYTNLASAFLVKSVNELSDNGRLAYIMPMEFLNSGYGKKIKKFLLNKGSVYKIIKLNDECSVFPEVTTTACIILFEKSKKYNSIIFSEINNHDTLEQKEIGKININDLDYNKKWLPFFEDNRFEIVENISDIGLISILEYGRFKRGIATGANEFFSLNKEKIEKLSLFESEVSMCLTKSNQVKKSILDFSDVENLIESNSDVFIFAPNKHEEFLSDGAKEYIIFGELNSYHNRYLTKNRKTWFLPESKEIFPILFGVFSRGEYKLIRNYTNIKSLTCFHGFVPNHKYISYIDRLFLFLKSDIGKKIISQHKRKYGNNLNKFEPSDLNSILVPPPDKLDLIQNELVKEEIAYLRKNNQLSNHFNKVITKIVLNEK